jgi:hypothetical protein
MALCKFTLYKYIKFKDGSWRYCKAAFYSNGKIKPNRCILGGKEEEHPEGAYYLHHKKQWILVGTDALEAQRQRNVRLDNEDTHGGQLSPNFIDRTLNLSQLFYRYTSGWYEKRGAQLYVNRGIGITGFPIRLGARPEISVFELFRT